jgi:hypothetical protein
VNDFDHVVSIPDPGEPEWVREPDDDYNADPEPAFETIEGIDSRPMLIIIGGIIHTWDKDLNNFRPSRYELNSDGKVVARAD